MDLQLTSGLFSHQTISGNFLIHIPLLLLYYLKRSTEPKGAYMSTLMRIFVIAAIIIGVIIALKLLTFIGVILFRLGLLVVVVGLIIYGIGKLTGKIK